MPANLTTKLGQLVDVLTPDTTNTRIGVANASPTRTLDVTGTFGASGASTLGGTLTAAAANFSGAMTGTTLALTKASAGDALTWTNGGATPKTGFLYSDSGVIAMFNVAGAGAGRNGIQISSTAVTLDINAGTNTAVFNASGFGIGRTPTQPLQVKVGTDQVFSLTSASSHLQIQAINDAANAYTQLELAGSIITFAPASTERARIDSSGNLLLGTTTAQALLTIKGATQIIGTGSSTSGGSGPSSGKIIKQATSSTSTNSVTVTGTGFSSAGWVNGVIKITAAGGTLYSSNQSGIFAVYSFQGLSGTAPRQFNLMGTAMTAGGTITISFAASTSETLVVTATMVDGNVPGSIPSQNMSMTVEVDYGYPFTLS